MQILLVMLGGAFGAGARYLASRVALAWLGPGYPWGTLFVNLAGGLLMGLLVGGFARMGPGADPWRLLLGTGVLGGFTTFSAFSLDVVVLFERGDWLAALGYVLVSVIGAVGALWLGLTFARAIA